MKLTHLYTLPKLIVALVLLTSSLSVQAMSFGIGLGSSKITPDGTSNLENINPDINAKITSPPISFSFQLHQGLSDSLFVEAGLADLGHIEKEQIRNNIPQSEGSTVAFKISSKEAYTALYGALGMAVFISDRLALYAKAGGNINQTEYTVKQVRNNRNSGITVEEDKVEASDIGLYAGVGLFFNLTDRLSIKAEIEDFGSMGDNAEVSRFFLPNTAENPEASGSRVQRAMVHVLFRMQ